MGSCFSLRAGLLAVALILLLPVASAAAPTALLPDAQFGDGGVARVGFRFKAYEGLGPGLVAAQPRGKLVVAGQILSEEGEPGSAVIARLDRRGRLDRSFGRRGKLRFHFPGPRLGRLPYTEFRLSTIVVQPDAKIVLAGTVNAPCVRIGCPTSGRFALVRVTRDGRIDRSFGDRGFVDRSPVRLGVSTGVVEARLGAVSLQADGSFLAGGTASEYFDDPAMPGQLVHGSWVVLMRFRSDGTLDDGFADSGERRLAAGLRWAYWAPAEGHKLLAMGPHSNSPDAIAFDGLAVIQFGTDGRPDPSFGSDGLALIRDSQPTQYRSIASGPPGEVLLSGGPGPGIVGPSVKLRRLRAGGQGVPGFHESCPSPDPRNVDVTAAIPFGRDSVVSAVSFVGRPSRRRTLTSLLRYGPDGCLRPRLSRMRMEGYLLTSGRDGRGRVLLGGVSGHSFVIVRLVPQRRAQAAVR